MTDYIRPYLAFVLLVIMIFMSFKSCEGQGKEHLETSQVMDEYLGETIVVNGDTLLLVKKNVTFEEYILSNGQTIDYMAVKKILNRE